MSKKKIVIVDDDRGFLEELKEALTLSGYEVSTVSDGNVALEIIYKVKPDVLLLDLKMDQKSGFQLAYELKFLRDVRIPVIAMTAFFAEKEHAQLMNVCGIQLCLKKPFNPQEAIAKIEGLLEERG